VLRSQFEHERVFSTAIATHIDDQAFNILCLAENCIVGQADGTACGQIVVQVYWWKASPNIPTPFA
jgi:hypothetical protein